MKIYLAGPFGFSETGVTVHNNVIIPLFTQLGHEILDPWTLTDQTRINSINQMPYGQARKAAWQALNIIIGENNRNAIDRCNIVFAVLDGVDVDSGTAAEIGYAFARGKTIVGYRGDFRLSADNDGAVVNLQVEYFIRKSGGDVVFKLADIPAALNRLKTQGT